MRGRQDKTTRVAEERARERERETEREREPESRSRRHCSTHRLLLQWVQSVPLPAPVGAGNGTDTRPTARRRDRRDGADGRRQRNGHRALLRTPMKEKRRFAGRVCMGSNVRQSKATSPQQWSVNTTLTYSPQKSDRIFRSDFLSLSQFWFFAWFKKPTRSRDVCYTAQAPSQHTAETFHTIVLGSSLLDRLIDLLVTSWTYL